MKALFVTTANAMGVEGKPKGGVQLWTGENLAVLHAAGFQARTFTFTPDQRFLTRIKRRLRPKPYEGLLPPSLAQQIADEFNSSGAQVVFLNLTDLAPLAKALRQLLGSKIKIILLSHGLHSADILHNNRIKTSSQGRNSPNSRELLWMAGHLAAESDQRKYIDHVFCLAEFEVGLEHWIGAKSVSWLPRIVEANPMNWQPISGRFGFVGTLDHPPNAEGLYLFLQALAPHGTNARIRVVGGPVEAGKQFAANYPAVDYLGPLDDLQLAREAATWSCAIHPLFCYARGCSTKLAIYLAWQIPVVTTPEGCRGYSWRDGGIPQANDPKSLVELALMMNNPDEAAVARLNLRKAAATSPTLREVAQMVTLSLANICHLT
jgi:hypothetical protein